jgi:hypothetical protein
MPNVVTVIVRKPIKLQLTGYAAKNASARDLCLVSGLLG